MTSRFRTMFGAVAVLALVAGAAPAAEAQDLRANIPFEFHAGKTMLAAGTYDITQPYGTSVVQLRTSGGGVILMGDASSPRQREAQAQLTFNRYGDRYFLSAVRFADDHELRLKKS